VEKGQGDALAISTTSRGISRGQPSYPPFSVIPFFLPSKERTGPLFHPEAGGCVVGGRRKEA
jgi:hypothetical protein